ncbi:MAG: 50S ribosomal protein L11 methyltransferase [Acidobacteriota bacterium]|nr:50S ribosomal protein L11 methyltransferase [Acidobacteriota bacterium]
MSLQLEEHRAYLADRPRVEALRRAIHATVRPGDVVLDLGCGTGVLGLIACEAGASRVYAVDDGGMIEIARAIAQASGYGPRIIHVPGHSTKIDLPERPGVLVFDQIGSFGFDAGLLEYALDARRRLLQPGARVMPGPVTVHVALASSAEIRSRIDFWDSRPSGIDASPARSTVENTEYPIEPRHAELHSEGAAVMTAVPASWDGEPLSGRVSLTAATNARVDGLAGWFVAELAPGITMTNAPADANRIDRRIAFLPFDRPIDLRAGDTLDVSVRLLAADMILAWDVSSADGAHRRSQSTWHGLLLVRETRQRTRGDAVPVLTARGEARRTLLELCDGVRKVADIERALVARHPDLFPVERDAAAFAAEVLAIYATS